MLSAPTTAPTFPDPRELFQTPRDYSFDAKPFSDVLKEIAERNNLEPLRDTQTIESAGVSMSTPVTGIFHGLSSAETLRRVLEQVGGGAALEYRIEAGRLVISTHDGFDARSTDTRVYDVRDLMIEIPDLGPLKQPASASSRSSEEIDKSRAARAALIKRVTTAIAPSTWGTTGSISPFQQSEIIVTQTPLRQLQVATYLEERRQERSVQVIVEARFLRISGAAAKASLSDFKEGTHRFLSVREVNDMIRMTRSGENSSIVTAPRITLFDGQYATSRIGQEIAYVKEISPVEGGLLKPKPAVLYTGIGMDIRCKTTPDHQAVTTQAEASVVELLEMQSIPAPNDPSLWIQLPITRVSKNSISDMIPSQSTLAFAAPAAAIEPQGAHTDHAAPGYRLFILIKPTVIVQTPSPAARPAK
jgi:hypothetical protein